MSLENFLNKIPPEGKRVLKGGQCQGNVVRSAGNICLQRFKPSLAKGSEYSAKYRAEEEKAHMESMLSSQLSAARIDLTDGEPEHSQMFEPEELTSIGTVPPNVNELEELTQVYQNYEFNDVVPNEHLEPIHAEREKILQMIELNQVCIIRGPTGCGKSTQVPQFILDSYVKRLAHCNIVVTQPRRIAAITIAQHVCKERDWQVGTIVGYQVGLDKSANEDTRLLYCTTGVLLEKLINTKHMNDFTHIILDEVHERDVDMDMTMLLVKMFLKRNSPNVKVVLMSATMDISRFADYYAVQLKDKVKQPAPFYEIKPANKFNVQVHYLDALKSITKNLPDIKISEPGIDNMAFNLVPIMIQYFNKIDAEDYKLKRSFTEIGGVLIFLPGLYQIEGLYDLLTAGNVHTPIINNLWICPLHSSITKDEQEKVRHYAPPGKRKIILSTNLAESSLTIPDVKYVIDFCLTKHLVADSDTGFTSLRIAWASHTNCIQREGRVGRVQDGRVYRMVPKEFYMYEMSKECMPEMVRCPLDVVVLKCKKMLEDDCPLRMLSFALDPPDLSNYEKTILKLKQIGALLMTCKDKYTVFDGDLTFAGRVMASLPLDIYITKLILLGHTFDVLEDAIIMGCAISVQSLFSERFQKRMESYNHKLMWADSSESDLIALLNVYKVWRQLTGMGKFERSVSAEETWARRYMLQLRHLKEMAKQECDIKKRLTNLHISVSRERNQPNWSRRQKPLVLKLVIAGAFYPHYYIRSAQNPNAEGEAVKSLAGHSPYNSVYIQNMPQPIPVYMEQLEQRLRDYNVAENFQIFHDSSRKVIVSFDSGQEEPEEIEIGGKNLQRKIPGEIVMPVYRAIKLRQLNLPLIINTLPKQQIEEKMLSYKSRNSSRASIHRDFKPQISLNNNYIEIEVVYVENAGRFFAHIQPSTDKIQRIHFRLNKPSALVPLKGPLETDVIYAAPYRDNAQADLEYYRAKITDKTIVEGTLHVEVVFIDFGNRMRVIAHDLRQLASEDDQELLAKIPPLALECTLAEVAPGVWSQQEGQWAEEATSFVTKTLSSKRTWYAKIYSYVNEVASIYVFLDDGMNPSNSEPLTMNIELVKRGFARQKDESYFSKLNNAKRVELEEKGESISISSSDSSFSCMYTSLRDFNMLVPPTTTGRCRVELKGPNSPLEMKLFSLSYCSTQKEVKVDCHSVNSVLLDSDPNDPHERLLVAGSVCQSPDGRKLSLNHTTVLPNMHGMAALVCLIFAPVVELRADECYSRYTGALCGLGAEQGVSLFPANDLEISFDVQFVAEDLVNINRMRYWMNELLCSDCTNTFPELLKIQKNIRNLTISLLKEVRQSIKVHKNPTQFQWDQVPESKLQLPFPFEVHLDYSKYVYKLHGGIKLQPNQDIDEVTELAFNIDKLESDIRRGETPRQLKCVLCDVDFQYCTQLRLHMTTNYHLQLVKWLNTRRAAYNI